MNSLIRGPLIDKSGTTTGSNQVVIAQNPRRSYLIFVNLSDTVMWINFGAAAAAGTAGSIPILPYSASAPVSCGAFECVSYVPTDALNVICASSGKAFTCKEGGV